MEELKLVLEAVAGMTDGAMWVALAYIGYLYFEVVAWLCGLSWLIYWVSTSIIRGMELENR